MPNCIGNWGGYIDSYRPNKDSIVQIVAHGRSSSNGNANWNQGATIDFSRYSKSLFRGTDNAKKYLDVTAKSISIARYIKIF